MEEESVRRTGTAEDGVDDSELIAANDRAHAQIQEQSEARTTDSSEKASGQQQPPMISHQLQSQLADNTPSDGYASWMHLPSSSHDGPPMPLPQPVFSEDSQENDALSSMLMAWYMSGYHTGYYQALQESQQAVTHECHK